MPSSDTQRWLLPSVLDRLADGESTSPSGGGHRQILDAVRRDLEELLNTRQTDTELREFTELARSIAAYGLPDLTNYHSATALQCDDLCRVVEAVIAQFEPRLRNVRVRIHDAPNQSAVAIRFHIEAALNVDPSPDVAFETVLELITGRSTVRSDGVVV